VTEHSKIRRGISAPLPGVFAESTLPNAVWNIAAASPLQRRWPAARAKLALRNALLGVDVAEIRPGVTKVPLREAIEPACVRKLIPVTLLILFALMSTAASHQDCAAADAVASAFMQARQAAHLSQLDRMGRNTFRKKVCKQDMRFSSGLIKDVVYQTSDPAQIPESAQRLATWPDTSKTAARFGVGVCSLNTNSVGQPKYSVLIATYESRSASFWRIFWD
jgi:hypothetical protein